MFTTRKNKSLAKMKTVRLYYINMGLICIQIQFQYEHLLTNLINLPIFSVWNFRARFIHENDQLPQYPNEELAMYETNICSYQLNIHLIEIRQKESSLLCKHYHHQGNQHRCRLNCFRPFRLCYNTQALQEYENYTSQNSRYCRYHLIQTSVR